MKHIIGSILLLGLLNCHLIGEAQHEKSNTKDTVLRSFLKFEISFYIGPAWEQRIGKASALEFLAGMGIGGQTDKLFDFKARFIVTPITLVEYRNYYNFKKRIVDNKRIKNNSANFLYGKVQTLYPIKNQNFFGLVFGQGWGLQRSLNKHLGGALCIGVLEHFYYDKPPVGGFNYLKIEPDLMTSIFYAF